MSTFKFNQKLNILHTDEVNLVKEINLFKKFSSIVEEYVALQKIKSSILLEEQKAFKESIKKIDVDIENIYIDFQEFFELRRRNDYDIHQIIKNNITKIFFILESMIYEEDQFYDDKTYDGIIENLFLQKLIQTIKCVYMNSQNFKWHNSYF